MTIYIAIGYIFKRKTSIILPTDCVLITNISSLYIKKWIRAVCPIIEIITSAYSIILWYSFFFYFVFWHFCISFPSEISIEELQNARESESKYKQQNIEALKREKMLIRRLAAKEQEMQEYVVNTVEYFFKLYDHVLDRLQW